MTDGMRCQIRLMREKSEFGLLATARVKMGEWSCIALISISFFNYFVPEAARNHYLRAKFNMYNSLVPSVGCSSMKWASSALLHILSSCKLDCAECFVNQEVIVVLQGVHE